MVWSQAVDAGWRLDYSEGELRKVLGARRGASSAVAQDRDSRRSRNDSQTSDLRPRGALGRRCAFLLLGEPLDAVARPCAGENLLSWAPALSFPFMVTTVR